MKWNGSERDECRKKDELNTLQTEAKNLEA